MSSVGCTLWHSDTYVIEQLYTMYMSAGIMPTLDKLCNLNQSVAGRKRLRHPIMCSVLQVVDIWHDFGCTYIQLFSAGQVIIIAVEKSALCMGLILKWMHTIL